MLQFLLFFITTIESSPNSERTVNLLSVLSKMSCIRLGFIFFLVVCLLEPSLFLWSELIALQDYCTPFVLGLLHLLINNRSRFLDFMSSSLLVHSFLFMKHILQEPQQYSQQTLLHNVRVRSIAFLETFQ